MTTLEILQNAKNASREIALLDAETKNQALNAMADALIQETPAILDANAHDVQNAKGIMSDIMIDRLTLTEARIQAMADGVRDVALLADPVGSALSEVTRPNGLLIRKICVPLGVIAIIFESRPNVASDAAALALKSGNACVLRGGKEAYGSVKAIVRALRKGLHSCGVNPDAVCQVEDTTREGANTLMTARGLVDLLIPRGGAGLIRACAENARVPVIETGTGICHIYVDKDADLDMALDIVENAKTSRPSVCNAEEALLVHKDVAAEFLPRLRDRLVKRRADNHPVEMRLDERAAAIIPGTPASEADFDTEFLDYILAVAVVDDLDAAISHIARHSTHHSEAILSESVSACERFVREVDSAAVYVNASTRFTDGGEFGLGCEMGISTQKLHARGPMGIRELTTYKYVALGSGQIR